MQQRITVADPETWPAHIRARYGVDSRRRWLLPLALLSGLALLAVVTFAGLRVTHRAISAGIASYSVQADDRIAISYAVTRRQSVPATCVLRARAEDGFDVGYAVVHLPADSGATAHSFAMRTAYRAVIGELLGCAVGDEPPPGISPAQFRAGVVPPDQPWTAG